MEKDHDFQQECFCREQKAGSCTFLIFGGSGDLAERKLFPAFFTLYCRQLLHEDTRIIACARHPYSTDPFREKLLPALQRIFPGEEKNRQIKAFLEKVSYCMLDYGRMEDFTHLAEVCGKTGLLICYLALPSSVYAETVRNLSAADLLRENPERNRKCRVVFEKPFGLDLASFRSLDRELKKYLREEQIYRIDHYLGKETVQNLFLLRFANVIFEEIWNRKHIDSIQITAAETLGVENRGGYFDQAGILRDMFQNHLLELLSLVTMERPGSFSADAVRDEKRKLIRAICPIVPEDTVRGQYASYTSEPGIAPCSRTETFAALRLFVDSERWRSVPIYLRAGKKLSRKETAIHIVFRKVDRSIFPGIPEEGLRQNILHLSIAPQEEISLTLQAKKPGPKLCMGALTLCSSQRPHEGGPLLPAYARLLQDCQLGDQMLFPQRDVIESAWELFQGVLDRWREDPSVSPLIRYQDGSCGPDQSQALLWKDRRKWIVFPDIRTAL